RLGGALRDGARRLGDGELDPPRLRGSASARHCCEESLPVSVWKPEGDSRAIMEVRPMEHSVATTAAKLTYEDLLGFPGDDGLRHEILDGEHHVSPSPNVRHQTVLQ